MKIQILDMSNKENFVLDGSNYPLGFHLPFKTTITASQEKEVPTTNLTISEVQFSTHLFGKIGQSKQSKIDLVTSDIFTHVYTRPQSTVHPASIH